MRLDVVTPVRTLIQADVDEVIAPGSEGEFGVLPGHIPFLTAIRAGVVRYAGRSGNGSLAVGPGFAEVSNDRIVVLSDVGMKVDEIDVAAAQKELAAAQNKLDHWQSDDAGAHAEVEAQRNWAQARLDAAARRA